MKKYILLIVLALPFAGCRYYGYTKRAYIDRYYHIQRIDMDTDYTLYVRQVGKPKSEQSPIMQNFEDLPANDREKIEIQYLLVSPHSGRVLYFTTIPPYYTGDREHKWIYDMPVFQKDNFVNLWYLNLFYIGRLDQQRQAFYFTGNDAVIDTITYKLSVDSNALTFDLATDNLPRELQHFKSAKPDTTFNFPMKFLRKDNYHLGIDGYWHDDKFSKGVTLTGSYRAIYYATKGCKTNIFFNIGKDPDNLQDTVDDWMHFKPNRVRARP